MTFQPRQDLIGMNTLMVPHRPAPLRIVDDPDVLEDMRDTLARDIDAVLQWLYLRARDFRFNADAELDPRELCELVRQQVEESALFAIDQRLQELRDANPPAFPVRVRPGADGSHP